MKNLFLLVLLLSSTGLFAQKKSTVSGVITNPNSDKIYLQYYAVEDKRMTRKFHDSTEVVNGKFELEAELDSLTYLQVNDGQETAFIYLSPGENLYLTLNTKYFDETITFSGDGGARNNMMRNIFLMDETVNDKFQFAKYKLFETAEIDSNAVFQLLDTIEYAMIDFINDEKKTFPEMEFFLDQRIDSYSKNTERRKKSIRQEYKKKEIIANSVGKQFADATGIDLDDKEIKISSFYGQITVLDFWATWCGPCKYEFPFLHELEEKYEGKVTFVGVAISSKIEAWKEMAKAEGFHNNIYLDRDTFSALHEKYLIPTIPRYMILDEEGKIINIEAGRPSGDLSVQLDEALEK